MYEKTKQNMGTRWFLLMFKMMNVGTTDSLLSKTMLWLLSVSLSRCTVSL